MPHTIDEKLNEGLQLCGMSVEQFAALAALYQIPKASKAKLYESFRGGKALGNETALRLWKLWERIEDLCERAKPFPIALTDASHVKLLLDVLADGVDLSVGSPISVSMEEPIATTAVNDECSQTLILQNRERSNSKFCR
jgi:hypothetical protein